VAPANTIIRSEYRFVIINNRVVTGSQYVDQMEICEDYALRHVAQSIANKLDLRFYTMDLCRLENGDIKLIELNSFESAGWYECHIPSIIRAFGISI